MNPISTENRPQPAEDASMDALLHEYARLKTNDDEAFLSSFEEKLTKSLTAQPKPPKRLLTTVFWPVATAATIAGMLYFTQGKPQGKRANGEFAVTPREETKFKEGMLNEQNLPANVPLDAVDGMDFAKNTTFSAPDAPAERRKVDTKLESRVDEPTELAAATPPPAAATATPAKLGQMLAKRENLSAPSAAPATLAQVAEGEEVSRFRTTVTKAKEAKSWGVDFANRGRREQSNSLWYSDNYTATDAQRAGDKFEATAPVTANDFLSPAQQPLSTFSVDVDTASYANVRRMIQAGQAVPAAAVRIEEMVNYFTYQYAQPAGAHPFGVQVESTACPWKPEHRLVKIGLQAKEIEKTKRPTANLVFLVDVSGSMAGADRLQLLLENLKVMTKNLSADDTVSIVVYAGNEGLALPPTSGGDQATILAKLSSLSAGGSTNGGSGIKLAYQTARSRFLKEGINRVVLCTDGDFNVGLTSQQDLLNLVQTEAKDGIFLTVCGYGQGNLNDAMLEAITNKGNGVYHYIDSEKEGRKVFQDELFGTLITVAKDVKLQVEFNPAKVASYRLVGYENRRLANEDFANDKVDAGDIGSGHRVTALYEIVPPNATPAAVLGALKYQNAPAVPAPQPVLNDSSEMLTVKLRYKLPTATESVPFDSPFTEAAETQPSADLAFAGVVAEFGQRLRGTLPAGTGRSVQTLIDTANEARGNDPHGLRAEFIELLRAYSKTQPTAR